MIMKNGFYFWRYFRSPEWSICEVEDGLVFWTHQQCMDDFESIEDAKKLGCFGEKIELPEPPAKEVVEKEEIQYQQKIQEAREIFMKAKGHLRVLCGS